MKRFKATIEPVSRGGHLLVVPERTANAAGFVHGSRTRGTLNGVPFRAAVMKHGGVFYLGVHKATLASANADSGDEVQMAIELDDEPLPTDQVPEDFAKALARSKAVAAAWERLAPSHKREHVAAILGAKKPETRARRIAKAIDMLAAAPAPRSAKRSNG